MLRILVLMQSIIGFSINALTLNEVVELAEKQSFNQKIYESKLNEIDKKIQRNRLNLLPEFNIVVGQEKTFYDSKTDSEDLLFGELRLNLFNGGKNKKQKKRLELSNEFQKLSLNQREFDIRQRIIRVFFEHNYFSLFSQTIKKLKLRNTDHIKMIEKRLKSGIGNESDLLEYQYSQKRIELLEKEINSRKLDLKKIIALMISRKSTSFELNIIDVKALKKVVVKEKKMDRGSNNHSIREIELKNQSNLLDQNIVKSSLYPSIDFELRHGRQAEPLTGINNRFISTSAAVTLTWGIDDFFKSRKSLDLSKAVHSSNQYLKKKIKRDLRIEFSRIQTAIQNILSINKGLSESINLAKSLYKRVLTEYKRGIKDSSSLVGASNEIFEIEKSLLGNQREYYKKLQEVEAILGQKVI